MKPIKLLIVEDDPTSDLLLSIELENYCCEILHAENGEIAVDICRSNPDIDLILMDIKLPVMSGVAATKKIREFNKDVIIIAQTAHAFAEDHIKIRASGCNDIITKPLQRKVLLNKISEYINIEI